MSTRTYLSIGDVLSLLREEFPDVTISKIRFLESQGLVNPERSPSGYRKFYEQDVERLRWVLRQQREHFLPLKVIRDRLAQTGAGGGDFDMGSLDGGSLDGASIDGRSLDGSPIDVAVEPELAHAAALPAPASRHLSAAAVGPVPASVPPQRSDGANAAARIGESIVTLAAGGPGDRSLRPLGTRPLGTAGPVAERAHEHSVGPDAGIAARGPAPTAAPTVVPGASRASAPTASPSRQVPRASDAGGAGAGTTHAPGVAPPAGPAGPFGLGSASAGRPPVADGPVPASAGGAPPATREQGTRSGPPALQGRPERTAAPAERTAVLPAAADPGTAPPGTAERTAAPSGTADHGPRTLPESAAARPSARSGGGAPPHEAASSSPVSGASLTLDELCAASGISVVEVASLEGFGMIEPMTVAGARYYDEEALIVANLVADLARYGIEPRHLRLYKNAVDREVGLVEQIVTPLLRQRNPESRQRACDVASEVAKLGQAMHSSLLRRELRRRLGR